MRKQIRTMLFKSELNEPAPGTKAHARMRIALGMTLDPTWEPEHSYISELRNKMPRPQRIPPLAPEGGKSGTRQGSFRECRFHVFYERSDKHLSAVC